MPNTDLTFPSCCTLCPHRDPFTGTCTHSDSQSLTHILSRNEPCPIYKQEKTARMKQLAKDLQ